MSIKIKTKVDNFGRIIIPKKLRQDFGIKNNSDVFLESGKSGILIHSGDSLPPVKDEGGVIVVCSESTEEFDDFLKTDRENRIRKTAKDIYF